MKNKIKHTTKREGIMFRFNRDKEKIIGISIYNDDYKDKESSPLGYCGCIDKTSDFVEIWTNGKYCFIPKEKAIKLFKELIKRFEEENEQR